MSSKIDKEFVLDHEPVYYDITNHAGYSFNGFMLVLTLSDEELVFFNLAGKPYDLLNDYENILCPLEGWPVTESKLDEFLKHFTKIFL